MTGNQWLNHKQPYYISLINGNQLRLEYWDEDLNKKRSIQRSVKEYGLRQAREMIFDIYKKRTGSKEKLKPLPKQNQHEIADENEKIIYYDDIFDIPFENFFENETTGSTMIICARSKSGKTTFLANLYEKILKQHFISILSSGSILQPIYQPFQKCIKTISFNEPLIQEVYTIAKHTKGNKYRFLIMADDLNMSDKHQHTLSNLITKWRNVNLSSIICCQDFTMITPTIRSNTNYFMIGNTGTERRALFVDMLYPYLANQSKSKSQNMLEIEKLIIEKTKNYKFIIVDNLNQKLYLPN